MKKTLFLSAMLGAVLCSTAMGATAVVADYTTTLDGTTYSGAILEYKGSGSDQPIGSSGTLFYINKSGVESTCKGGSQKPDLGGESGELWQYLSPSLNGSITQSIVYGQTLKMSGATQESSNVQLKTNWGGVDFTFGGLITTAAQGVNANYTISNEWSGLGDIKLIGNETAGVNMSIGANTTIHTTDTKTVEVATAGTWNIAAGKTLTLEGGRIYQNSGKTIKLTGGGILTFNITYRDHKLEMTADSKFDVTAGTTMVLNHQTTNYAFGNGAGIISSDNNGIVKLTGTNTIEHNATSWVDSFTGHLVFSGITLQVAQNSTRYASAASLTLADNGVLKGWGGNFNRNLILNGGGIGDAGADETFSGKITLQGDSSFVTVGNKSNNTGASTVTLSGIIEGTTLTKKGSGNLVISGENNAFGTLKSTGGTTDINAALTLSGSLESGPAIINVNKNVTAGSFASMGNNGRINITGGATLFVSDSNSGQGVWIDQGAGVTIATGSTLSIANGVLTLTASGAETATVGRLNTGNTAKLGVVKNSDGEPIFLKNVAVSNADVAYTGSGVLYLGSMNGGALSSTGNIEFAGTASTLGSLTLSGNTITLGTEANHDYTLKITSTLSVSGTGSKINANLEMNSGTMDFTSGAVLTMGCGVTIGSDVVVKLDSTMIDAIVAGQHFNLIEGVDASAVTLGHVSFESNDGRDLTGLGLSLEAFDTGDGKVAIRVAPEPATATLSLLALAGLCARRRRH